MPDNGSTRCTFNVQRINDVMVYELKILMTKPVFDVALPASKEVVDHRDFMSLEHQFVDQMRTNKTSPTGYLHPVAHKSILSAEDSTCKNV